MKYRTLGKTGFTVAEVGMGTWQLADDPDCWVGADLRESLKALYRYTDLGGNFIDTAWIYGWDDANPDKHPSEELIGKFLKESGRKKDLVVATKIAPKNFKWPALYGVPVEEVFPNDWVEKSVNDSLRSLGLESLDLVQFHVWQDEFAKQDEWKETIRRLTKQGKVRYWGLSMNDYQPSNCFKTVETGLIASVQFIFNIFHQRPEVKLLPFAKEHNLGLIARVPLDEGGLTGKFTRETEWPEGDFRRNYFAGERLDELVKRTDRLKELLDGEVKSLGELALRFVLSHDEVTSVIPGMRKPEYVEDNTAVADGRKLSSVMMAELKKHAWERNFYSGLDPYLEESRFVEA